jgi:c-di-GMP-binding flagellar brake protein YcgR
MERRFYKRIPVQVFAIVTTEDNVRLKVAAVDISSNGLGVECNIKQRNLITPGGSFIREGRPISVFVDLNLSDESGFSSKIAAKCHVMFSRRLSSNHCKIGLRYADIGNDTQQWLTRFIEKSLLTSQQANTE